MRGVLGGLPVNTSISTRDFLSAFVPLNCNCFLGLDPARPGFDTHNSSARLDSSDAHFVVGLHTGAGFVALSDPVGHVDFYPNGGSKQPHCQTEDIPREFSKKKFSLKKDIFLLL